MNRPLTDPEALIAALAEPPPGASPSEVPEPEVLLDYLAGRLSPEDEESVGRRLVASPEAARALLDLAELEAAGANAGERPSELAVLAGWKDLKRQLPVPVAWFRRLQPRLSSVAAAVLLVTTVGLGVWGVGLREQLHRPGVQVAKLVELPSRPRAGEEPKIHLARGQSVVLELFPTEWCKAYTVTIAGPETREPQETGGLKQDKLGRLVLQLPGLPGEYRLSLSGCEPRHEHQEHSFRIVVDAE